MFVVGGESLIDLVSEPRGADGIIRMTAHQGGSPMNCAIALSKLGNDTGFLCPISRDGFGGYILEPLAAAAVRPLLTERVKAPTTLAVVTFNDRMQAQYEFYRGAERDFTAERLVAALPEKLDLFQTGGFCPIEPEDAKAWLRVIDEAARRGATISIDPNVRPSLINDFEGYKHRLEAFLDRSHLIKMSDEDMKLLRPDLSVEAYADLLLAKPKCELVVVTKGEGGSQAVTASGTAIAPIWSPPVFGDTVGAGDSLMAGVISRLNERGELKPESLGRLDGEALSDVLRFGAVVAGLNCGHMGCVPPTRAEVDAVLSAN